MPIEANNTNTITPATFSLFNSATWNKSTPEEVEKTCKVDIVSCSKSRFIKFSWEHTEFGELIMVQHSQTPMLYDPAICSKYTTMFHQMSRAEASGLLKSVILEHNHMLEKLANDGDMPELYARATDSWIKIWSINYVFCHVYP